jgi:hypothetical protein
MWEERGCMAGPRRGIRHEHDLPRISSEWVCVGIETPTYHAVRSGSTMVEIRGMPPGSEGTRSLRTRGRPLCLRPPGDGGVVEHPLVVRRFG